MNDGPDKLVKQAWDIAYKAGWQAAIEAAKGAVPEEIYTKITNENAYERGHIVGGDTMWNSCRKTTLENLNSLLK